MLLLSSHSNIKLTVAGPFHFFGLQGLLILHWYWYHLSTVAWTDM